LLDLQADTLLIPALHIAVLVHAGRKEQTSHRTHSAKRQVLLKNRIKISPLQLKRKRILDKN